MINLYRVYSKFHIVFEYNNNESITFVEMMWALERDFGGSPPYKIEDVIEKYDPNWRSEAPKIDDNPNKIRQRAAQELFTVSEAQLFCNILKQAGHQHIQIEEVKLPLPADTFSFHWTTYEHERWHINLSFGKYRLEACGLPFVPKPAEISETIFSALVGNTNLSVNDYRRGVHFLQDGIAIACRTLNPNSDFNYLYISSEGAEQKRNVCVCDTTIMKTHHVYGGSYIKFALQMGLRPDSDGQSLIRAVKTIYEQHHLVVRPLSDNIPYG